MKIKITRLELYNAVKEHISKDIDTLTNNSILFFEQKYCISLQAYYNEIRKKLEYLQIEINKKYQKCSRKADRMISNNTEWFAICIFDHDFDTDVVHTNNKKTTRASNSKISKAGIFLYVYKLSKNIFL